MSQRLEESLSDTQKWMNEAKELGQQLEEVQSQLQVLKAELLATRRQKEEVEERIGKLEFFLQKVVDCEDLSGDEWFIKYNDVWGIPGNIYLEARQLLTKEAK